jgi:hypothetical protein
VHVLIEDCAGLASAEPQTWGAGPMNNTIFVGPDVHKEKIAVAVAEGGRGGEVRQLGNFLAPSFCNEGGRFGNGLYRRLIALGHACTVAAPSLIPMKAGDRVKTDRRDAVMLAKLHRAGELTAAWVPRDAHEAMRDLIRARDGGAGIGQGAAASARFSSPAWAHLRRQKGVDPSLPPLVEDGAVRPMAHESLLNRRLRPRLLLSA